MLIDCVVVEFSEVSSFTSILPVGVEGLGIKFRRKDCHNSSRNRLVKFSDNFSSDCSFVNFCILMNFFCSSLSFVFSLFSLCF